MTLGSDHQWLLILQKEKQSDISASWWNHATLSMKCSWQNIKSNLTKPLDLTAKIHKYRGDKTTLNDIMETELREPQIWKILLRQTTWFLRGWGNP